MDNVSSNRTRRSIRSRIALIVATIAVGAGALVAVTPGTASADPKPGDATIYVVSCWKPTQLKFLPDLKPKYTKYNVGYTKTVINLSTHGFDFGTKFVPKRIQGKPLVVIESQQPYYKTRGCHWS